MCFLAFLGFVTLFIKSALIGGISISNENENNSIHKGKTEDKTAGTWKEKDAKTQKSKKQYQSLKNTTNIATPSQWLSANVIFTAAESIFTKLLAII